MYPRLIVILFSFLCLYACDGKVEESTQAGEKEEVVEAEINDESVSAEATVDDDVVAKVNGSVITKDELDYSVRQLLGEEEPLSLEKKAQRKILDSLVMSRAISLRSQEEMSKEEIDVLNLQVASFREQQLVRHYLVKHGKPNPISMEMIKDYYEKHPDQFGEKVLKTYELLVTTLKLPTHERDALLALLSKDKNPADWQEWAGELAAAGYPVAFRKGKSDSGILHSRFSTALKFLRPGAPPQQLVINEMLYLVRVVNEEKISARPLADVTGEIKKILAPKQVKLTVEQAGKEVLADTDVEYVE